MKAQPGASNTREKVGYCESIMHPWSLPIKTQTRFLNGLTCVGLCFHVFTSVEDGHVVTSNYATLSRIHRLNVNTWKVMKAKKQNIPC